MSMTSGEMTSADIFAVTCGGRRDRDDGLFGGDGIVGLIALIIISGMFGFGGFGFGGGGMGGIFPWLLMSGGFNGFGGYGGNAAVQGALTRGDLCMDMNFNDVQNGVRNVNDAVNTGFANLNSTICHQQYDTAMLDELHYKLCNALKKIAEEDKLNANDVEIIKALTGSIKNIDEIRMFEHYDGYSERGTRHSYRHDGDGMRMDDGYSGARRGEHYVRGHYSRGSDAEHVAHELHELMERADNAEIKSALKRAIHEIEV